MPYVNTDLFLICRHLYTSLPRSRIILIVMDGAILLRPLVTTLADGMMTWLSLILMMVILQYLWTAITSVSPQLILATRLRCFPGLLPTNYWMLDCTNTNKNKNRT